jgi:MFS family permease
MKAAMELKPDSDPMPVEGMPPAGVTDDVAEAEYERFVWANLRRNYAGNYVHGMLGMTGFRLVNAPTFIPAYLYSLSGSDTIVGLGLGLQQLGGIISPVVGAQQVEHRPRLLPAAMLFGVLMRVPILLMALAGWLFDSASLLVSLLVLLFFLGLFSGPQRVVFNLLMAKVIPISRRGRLQAWRNVTGGTIAAVLSYFAGVYLIEQNILGNGYSTTFLLAFILTSLGLTAIRLLLVEPTPPQLPPRMRFRERMKDFPQLLGGDRDFRNFLLAQMLAMAASIAGPFYVLYCGTSVPLTGSTLGILSLAFLGADTLSNLVWGYLGDRSGFRVGFIISLVIWIASTALLMSVDSLPWFAVALFGLGAARSGYMMSAQTLILEFGSRQDTAMRIGISSTLEGAVSATGPLIGGIVAAAAGYSVVFAISIVVLTMALVMLAFGVREPRYRSDDASGK